MSTPPDIDSTLAAVKAEFIYAQRWDRQRDERNAPEAEYDRNKPVESWLVYIQHHLNKALTIAGSTTDKRAALDEVRKVANLAVACLAYRECPKRMDYDQAAHDTGRVGWNTDDPTRWHQSVLGAVAHKT